MKDVSRTLSPSGFSDAPKFHCVGKKRGSESRKIPDSDPFSDTQTDATSAGTPSAGAKVNPGEKTTNAKTAQSTIQTSAAFVIAGNSLR